MIAVFDSSALLAYLHREAGADAVEQLFEEFEECLLSAVNAAETLTRLIDGGQAAVEAAAVVRYLPVEVVPFDFALAVEAASLRPGTRHAGLSLGDRACLALARQVGARAITADRAWQDVDAGVPIVLVR